MDLLSHNHSHSNAIVTLANIHKYDPTHLLTLRNRFSAKMAARFNNLKKLINKVIIDLDVFKKPVSVSTLADVSEETAIAAIQRKHFEFARDPQKVSLFMDWLAEMEDEGILEMSTRFGTIRGVEEAWTDVFIQTAYQKGVLRARQEARKIGVDVPAFENTGGVISYCMNNPFHINKLGLMFTRSFNELKGITDAMDQQISRVLTQGIAEGKGPREVARNIVDRVDNIGIVRARTLARTEITRAHHMASVTEYKQLGLDGVTVIAEWSTRGTPDVCPDCASLDGKYFTLDKIEGMIPFHPNCLVDGQIKIYTSNGWVPIKDIIVGDLVLSHEGRFQKVTKIHHTPKQKPNVVRFKFGTMQNQKLTVTEDHPILVGNKWVAAKEINVGDTIKYLASRCKECGELIPYYKTFCDKTCWSHHTVRNQWADPEHRKNISEKTTSQLKREYKLGLRDGDKITFKAHEKTREMAKLGILPFKSAESVAKMVAATHTPELNARHSVRMKKDNPMFNPDVKEKAHKSLLNLYELHPEKRINSRMAKYRKSGRKTDIEQKMADLLDRIGVYYVFQYPILRYNVDFAIPALKIAIECDGNYWHKNTVEEDAIRQKKIEDEGWFVLRYDDKKINKCLDEVEDELARVFGNHNGDYEFAELKITDVEKWQIKKSRCLYNLSVENDESYVANGFVIHNCRCIAIPVLPEYIEKNATIND